MDTFEQIKKFLDEGGKCLLIENGKPIGVVLTMEEYELFRGKSQITNHKSQTNEINLKAEKLLIPDLSVEASVKAEINSKSVADSENPIGEAMAKEMDFLEASAELADIASADDITLEDLGLDPDIQLPKDF